MKIDLDALLKKEEEIYNHLKDFQCATVERVDYLFSKDMKRILVADEVGLGKTLIARGTIIKQAIKCYKASKSIFKVVYICSNQNIANQNISKLDLFGSYDNYAQDARLSMQHLVIRETEEHNKSKYIQLVPLTPDTSFRIGGKRLTKGTTRERALIYIILNRISPFDEYDEELKYLLTGNASSDSFCREVKNFRSRVEQCELDTNGEYPDDFVDLLLERNKESHELDTLIDYLECSIEGRETALSAASMIGQLRVMFAKASISRFNPDLVILDEFQRFKYMLDPNLCDEDTNALVDLFFSNQGNRTLMLSATPYKLYSTLDELDDPNADGDHYSEFKTTVKFLLNDEEYQKFSTVWENFQTELREYAYGLTATINIKQKAEDALYSVISRTERISVMDTGDYIDDSSVKSSLKINEADVRSFLELEDLIRKVDISETRLAEYVKSSPYLMSYMSNYVVKKKVDGFYDNHPGRIDELDRQNLWLNYDDVNEYKDIRITNSRLRYLFDKIISSGVEKYLWVPPSYPYYRLQGPYENSRLFSKYIIFSSWEMVPRMISTLLSYEIERLTIKRVADKSEKKTTYSDTNRFLANRLRLDINHMSSMSLVYPSKTMARLYNPIRCLDQKMTLDSIVKSIQSKVRTLLPSLKKYENAESMANREMWYYLAPVLLDYENDSVEFEELNDDWDNWAFTQAKRKLYEYLYNSNNLKLGKMPDDLSLILTYEAIGSFGNCAYRANGGDIDAAAKLAQEFIYYFNTPESAAVIMLSYHDAGDNHWKNILKYCVDGCLQSVLDEYYHIIGDGIQASDAQMKRRLSDISVLKAFDYQTGSFRINVNPIRRNSKNAKTIGMRTHYAACFRKTSAVSNNESETIRIDSIRNAFNSPFKPFVLASTSIGQEGLDFHQYCRKIVHWNLPSNPIDIEQREGRINRYKCLAIRQDIGQRFVDEEFKSNVWNELFNKAVEVYREPGQSELVPFWCLGKDQRVKIERIVPMYPISKDCSKYERLIEILSLYRMTLGQSRQEELVEYLLKGNKTVDEVKPLFIDLSPYSRVENQWKSDFFEKRSSLQEETGSDAIKEVEMIKELIHTIRVLEDHQLQLEIELEDTPPLSSGMIITDRIGNNGKIVSYNENEDYVSVDFGGTEPRVFCISKAIGKAISITDPLGKKIYDKRSKLKEAIEVVKNRINEYRDELHRIE